MDKVTIELSKDEALVLFEYLSRLDESDALPTGDAAEERALWGLLGQLESKLVEPFDPAYKSIIEKAKKRLINE